MRSRSDIAVLDDDARAAKIEELLAFYDDYGRGMDGMQLPYLTPVLPGAGDQVPARRSRRPPS